MNKHIIKQMATTFNTTQSAIRKMINTLPAIKQYYHQRQTEMFQLLKQELRQNYNLVLTRLPFSGWATLSDINETVIMDFSDIESYTAEELAKLHAANK